MRRPVRDERFTDPDGNPWQVEKVLKWRTETRKPTEDELKKGKPNRPITCGTFNVEGYVMVNANGERRKVAPLEMEMWAPATLDDHRIGDPLEGHRKRLTEAVRDGKRSLSFDGESPVSKGERYHLPCGEIVIGNTTLKTNKRGEKTTEVKFTHVERDKVYFLRSTVPGARPDELVKPPTQDDIERARIDGNYLTGAPESGGDKLPTVPPDWKDEGASDRERRRLEAMREGRAEQNMRRQSRQIKAKLDEVNRLGAQGIDLTHELDDIIERLNGAMKDAA